MIELIIGLVLFVVLYLAWEKNSRIYISSKETALKNLIVLLNDHNKHIRESELPICDPFTQLVESGFVAIDVETTGLKTATSKIIQITLIKYKSGLIHEKFSTYVNPGVKIPPNVTKVNKITNKTVKHAPTFEHIKNDIIQFINYAPLVGHNLSYDIAILENELERHDVHHALVWGYCTMKEAFLRNEEKTSPGKYLKLAEAAQRHGIKVSGHWHSSDTDAEAAGELLLCHAKKNAQKRQVLKNQKTEIYFTQLNTALKEVQKYAEINAAEYIRKAKSILIERENAGCHITSDKSSEPISIGKPLELKTVKSREYMYHIPIIISCRYCSSKLRIPILEAGRKIKIHCPKCLRSYYWNY